MNAAQLHLTQLCLAVAGGLAVAAIAVRLVGANWLRGLFESEGEPSARIVMAVVVILFTLSLQALGRISDNMVEANYFLAGTLMGLGTTKLIATRFAQRPAAPATQIKTDKTEVAAAGDANIYPAANEPEQKA